MASSNNSSIKCGQHLGSIPSDNYVVLSECLTPKSNMQGNCSDPVQEADQLWFAGQTKYTNRMALSNNSSIKCGQHRGSIPSDNNVLLSECLTPKSNIKCYCSDPVQKTDQLWFAGQTKYTDRMAPSNNSSIKKIGIILDISGSMSTSATGLDRLETESWGKSMFGVINQIIENDISDKHEVFTIGCGAQNERAIIDILSTIESVSNVIENENPPDKTHLIEACFNIIRKNGAKYIRRWAPIDTVDQNVSHTHCFFVYKMLKNNLDFRNHFIFKILPKDCRNWGKPDKPNISISEIISDVGEGLVHNPVGAVCKGFYSLALKLYRTDTCQNAMENVYTAVASKVRTATPDEIKKIIKESMLYILKSDIETFSVQKASRILKGSVLRESGERERYKKLHDDIRPVIYGEKPLIKSLNIACSILKSPPKRENKFLFIFSDGNITDRPQIDPHAYVIGCYIYNKPIPHKKLFSTGERFTEKGAQFLYDISSTIQTQHLPRSIFISNHWTIDYKNGETKLFLQVNNPDNLDDACKFAKKVVTEHTSLSDALLDISLDIYIYKGTKDMKAKNQGKLPNCMAYAFATVIHVIMKQNPAFKDTCPSFAELCEEIQQHFRKQLLETDKPTKLKMLSFCCTKYKLISKKLTFEEALNAIKENHLIVATFFLSTGNMNILRHLKCDEQFILKKADLSSNENIDKLEKEGHAVVFTSYNSKWLTFMNSWGENWGFKGFLKVENSEVINFKFYKLELDASKFSDEDKRKINERGKNLANDLLQRYTTLKYAKFTCPKCSQSLKLRMFAGTIQKTTCLSCKRHFSCQGEGNIIALNLYLNTL